MQQDLITTKKWPEPFLGNNHTGYKNDTEQMFYKATFDLMTRITWPKKHDGYAWNPLKETNNWSNAFYEYPDKTGSGTANLILAPEKTPVEIRCYKDDERAIHSIYNCKAPNNKRYTLFGYMYAAGTQYLLKSLVGIFYKYRLKPACFSNL